MLLKKLVLVAVLATLSPTGAALGQNVLHYLELRDIGATPAEIILSPDYQTIIEFEGLSVSTASSGRADQITFENDEQTIRLRANQDIVNTDLTVRVGGQTALFTLRSDPSTTAPRRYIVRDSPPPPLVSIAHEGIEGKTDLASLSIGTKDVPPGVTLDLNVTRNQKGDVVIQYELLNEGEVAIVNESSRLNILNEDIKLRYTLSRVPPAGSANVIRPGESEYGTLIVPSPPNGNLTFLWVLVQLGPGGHYAVTRNLTELLEGTGQAATETTTMAATAPITTEPAATATPDAATVIAAPTPTVAPVDTTAALASGGVTLYEHDFSGGSVLLAGNAFYRADQGQFGDVGDNAVSSLIVPDGYRALLCDVQATPPCQEYGPGTYTVEPAFNDLFSFAQIFTTTSMATTPTPDTTQNNLVVNPNFDTNADGWFLWVDTEKGAKAQGGVKDGRYCTTVEAGSATIDVGQGDHTLEPNQTYTLSFDYQADRVTTFVAQYAQGNEPWTKYFKQEVVAGAGLQHFEQNFISTQTDPAVILSFALGGIEAGTNICLDNVVLTATPAPTATEAAPAQTTPQNNLVANGSFDDAEANHWYLWVNTDAGIKAQGSVKEGRYCVTTESATTDRNTVGLGQSGLALEPNTTYTLSLDYQADRVASFAATDRKEGDPWTEYFRQDVNADASVQHFEGSFTSTAAEPNTGLLFWFGANEVGTNICLDNITLTATPAPTDAAAEPAPAPDATAEAAPAQEMSQGNLVLDPSFDQPAGDP
jgi:Carbohydrate binding domain